MFLAGAAVEDPDHAQALRKGAIVDGVGQPGEARDFSFGGFTGFGQGGDETTLNTGVVIVSWSGPFISACRLFPTSKQ